MNNNKYNFWLGMDLGTILAISFVSLIIWIALMIWATRKKGWLGFFLVLIFGIFGAIVVAFLPADKERERERERERNFVAESAIFNIGMNC